MSWRCRHVILSCLILGACDPGSAGTQTPIVELDAIGVQAMFGLSEDAGPEAIFHKPLDAAFVKNGVAILDASPPWVRVFDREGRFRHAVVPQGDGPAEARQPLSLSSVSDGFLLGHTRGISRFSVDGSFISSVPASFRSSGAASGCGDELVGLAFDWVPKDDPASESDLDIATTLLRLSAGAEVIDTIATFLPTRPSSRSYHPWLVERSQAGIIIYPEYADRDVLIEFACDGRLIREIAIDSVGPGEEYTFPTEGQFLIASPEAPFPAGLEVLGDRILWAVRALEENAAGAVDTVTVVTVIEDDGASNQIRIRGWYQLLDSDASGRLLLSNTWTVGQKWQYGGTWGPLPGIFLVDGEDLLRATHPGEMR